MNDTRLIKWGRLIAFWAVLVVGLACIVKGPFSSEAAAWAQAFGSVGAILVAVYASHAPIRAEEARRRAELLSFAHGLRQAAWRATCSNEEARRWVDELDVTSIKAGLSLIAGSSHFLNTYLELPVESWPSADLFTRAGILQSSQRNAVDALRKVIGAPAIEANWLAAGGSLTSASFALQLLERAISELVPDVGSGDHAASPPNIEV